MKTEITPVTTLHKVITTLQVTTTPEITTTPEVKLLIQTIRTEIDQGKQRAIQAMEQEKRLTYWNVGKHIKQHLLQNQGREDYGKYVISQLAKELSLSSNLLYDSVRFYDAYPKIVHAHAQLSWSHIRMLVHVADKQARQAFEQKVIAEKLSSKELQKLVKNDKISTNHTEKTVLNTSRDKPYVYRFKKIQKQTMLDLGFMFYIQNPFAEPKTKSSTPPRTRKTDVIQIEKTNDKYQLVNLGNGSVPHYTYKAYVIEVIDGDTIWVNIDLGFNNWTTQKLRFKGINTKTIETAEGQSAKEYIESRLKGCKFIAVKTYWRDKFTRYLVDIFYKKKETDFIKVIESGKFLNQELLDKGLAVKY